jgi:hypothetical protein
MSVLTYASWILNSFRFPSLFGPLKQVSTLRQLPPTWEFQDLTARARGCENTRCRDEEIPVQLACDLGMKAGWYEVRNRSTAPGITRLHLLTQFGLLKRLNEKKWVRSSRIGNSNYSWQKPPLWSFKRKPHPLNSSKAGRSALWWFLNNSFTFR